MNEHDEPARDTLPYEDNAIFFTAVDDGLDHIIRPLIDLIVTIRVVDCEQPLDVYVNDVINIEGQMHLQCRHIDEHCDPIGDPWTVPIKQLAHIHIW